MNPIVVTASTEMELSLLVSGLSAVPAERLGHLKAFRGRCRSGEVIVAVTGIGKVNASCASTVVLERVRPRFLVNTGCGGAFPESGLAVGDLAIASLETLADEGVETPQGWRGLDLIGIPVHQADGRPVFNEIPVAPELSELALAHANANGYTAAAGRFLTVSTCSGTSERGNRLHQRYPGICENMEGGAVAQVALIYGVPFLEVRGISNLVEDRNLRGWDLPLAVRRVQEFLLSLLDA